MKNTLNKILYKLAEHELANMNISNINEQGGWEKLKNLFKRDKYDYTKATTNNVEPDNGDIVINIFSLDPPMENAIINSEWGKWRPESGRRHLGIDMRTPVGTPVYAVRPGTVVQVNDDPTGWGNYVITKHEPLITSNGTLGETFYALYAHLSDVSVSYGSELDFGTVIGKSGGAVGTPGAGNSRGAHLHFEIKTSENGGSIDPVKFYAKYRSKLENATLKDDSNIPLNSKQPDYIVNPTIKTSTSVPLETMITNNVIDSIISGKTEMDGFRVYKLPGDEKYLYAIPTAALPNNKYDWWTTSKTMPNWVSLKSKLSPNKYNTALSILNTAFPGAIDVNKLDTTEIPHRDNTTTNKNKKNNEPTPVNRDSNKKIFSLLVPGHAYVSTSVLKRKPKYKLYTIDPQTKKLVYKVNATIADVDNIVYIGHDTSNNYMHMQVVEPGIDPGNKNKYWISVNDIELKK
jgi:hypothetical protein